MKLQKTWLASAIIAGVVLLGAASSAEAQFRLRVEDVATGTGVVITDNGAGDLDGTTGLIISSGSIGSFAFTLTVGTSKPVIGGLDLNFTATTVTAGTIRVTLEDNGYSSPADGDVTLRSTVSGTLTDFLGSGLITLNSWVDPSNGVPDLGADTFPEAALGAIGAIPGTSVEAWPGSLVFAGSGPIPGGVSDASWTKAGDYSLFAQATVTFGAFGGTVDFADNQQVLSAIPAPGGLVLALTALPGFGFAWLRRRLKKTA